MTESISIITGLLAALALLGAVAAGYFWRRATAFYALLVEGSGRYDELRTRLSNFERQASQHGAKSDQQKELMATLERSILEARARAAADAKNIEAKEQDHKAQLDRLETQRSQLFRQLESYASKITTLEGEREHLLSSSSAATQHAQQLENRLHQTQRGEVESLKNQLNQTRIELQTTKEILKTADPEQLKAARRRATQYEKLFSSMRGLRELADERNKNWEAALRKLSSWVIKHPAHAAHAAAPSPKTDVTSTPSPTGPLGPLVGQALELIGEQLVVESPSEMLHAEREAMAAASHQPAFKSPPRSTQATPAEPTAEA